MKRALVVVACWLGAAGADELSGADKLRVLWSSQFAWTREGLPLVTVRVAEGRDEFAVSGRDLAVLPDGDGGAELHAGARWTVRLDGAGQPAKVRWHVVVARAAPSQAEKLQAEAAAWRARGFSPRSFESGALFAVRGAVIDNRRLLLAAVARDDEAAAQAAAKEIAAKYHVETSLHPEVVERSRGTLVARDEHGNLVRNDSVIWFAASTPITVAPVDGEARRSYFGAIYVTVDARGKLAAVNAVPEDKLLDGLLPAEMGAGAPAEALKAQAVAARNELLAKIGTRHLTDPYRLCASVHCQVYAGAGREDARTTAAVAATRGEVLVRGDGSLVDAVYSASCGGHTEDNDRAWGGPPDPSLRGALDADGADARALARFARVDDAAAFLGALPAQPYCSAAKGGAAFRWTARVPAAAIADAAGVGAIADLQVLERGVSGRAVRIKLVGARGEKEVAGELAIRRALGNLKSALFTFTVERASDGRPAAFLFSGGGHGHGIGLCQSGAMGMAERGKDYRAILQHYYRDATVKKLY